MTATIRLDVKGLVLAPGSLSRADGALVTADNVNAEAPGIIRSRNGFALQANGFGGPGWKFASTPQLGSNLLMNYGSNTKATGLRYGDGSAAATPITGNFTNQPATRMQTAVARKNHYLTTDEGVRRIESNYAGFYAGMPKGLQLDLTGPTVVLVGAPGFLADGAAVAYRVVWCKYDNDTILMQGAPAARTVVYNDATTSGYSVGNAMNVVARILLPQENGTTATALTTSYFFQLFRSKQVTPSAATPVPSDNMRLVAEAYLTAGNISAGYVDVTDSAPDAAFRDVAAVLYTNPSEGGDVGAGGPGIIQSNEPPPRARDVFTYADCLFLTDLQYRHRLVITIQSVVNAIGLSVGDVLTISGQAYTGIAPGAPTAGQFVVVAGVGDEKIRRTAQNLAEAINKNASNTTIYAFATGTLSRQPGELTLERRDLDTGFTAIASAHGGAYRPQLTATASSSADAYTNGLAFSKPGIPDAVPRVNLMFLPRQDASVLRTAIVRDVPFVFTDAGLFRLTGRTWEDFALQEFDLSFRLAGRELLAVCDDAAYAWGIEGIARITTAGVEYISNSIDPLLWQYISTIGLTWLGSHAWATAFRSRHKVLFALPTSSSDANSGNATDVLVYDTRMKAWTRWLFKRGSDNNHTQGHSCGAVRYSDDLLFLGQWNNAGNDSSVYKERRTFTAADYKDDTFTQTNQAITKTVKWAVVSPEPDVATHFDELHLFFENSDTIATWVAPTAVSAAFTSDFGGSDTSTLAPTAGNRFSRSLVPQGVRRSSRLNVQVTHAVAGEFFGLEGVAVTHVPEGNVTGRT